MNTRHEFLAALHGLLKPKVYVEIGVQWGTSLDLADRTITQAYGVDPDPLVERPGLFRLTSDEFFDSLGDDGEELLGGRVDLGFIDGMHLVEYALRDFIGLERLARPATYRAAVDPAADGATMMVQVAASPSMIVFDDVLPRNQAEAARTQCPGDWTGDVWRIQQILGRLRLDLDILLVDTAPTGLLVVTNLNPSSTRLTEYDDEITQRWPAEDTVVPDDILTRAHAWAPDAALDAIGDWWRIVTAQSESINRKVTS